MKDKKGASGYSGLTVRTMAKSTFSLLVMTLLFILLLQRFKAFIPTEAQKNYMYCKRYILGMQLMFLNVLRASQVIVISTAIIDVILNHRVAFGLLRSFKVCIITGIAYLFLTQISILGKYLGIAVLALAAISMIFCFKQITRSGEEDRVNLFFLFKDFRKRLLRLCDSTIDRIVSAIGILTSWAFCFVNVIVFVVYIIQFYSSQ